MMCHLASQSERCCLPAAAKRYLHLMKYLDSLDGRPVVAAVAVAEEAEQMLIDLVSGVGMRRCCCCYSPTRTVSFEDFVIWRWALLSLLFDDGVGDCGSLLSFELRRLELGEVKYKQSEGL
jgi:hypothetical protein